MTDQSEKSDLEKSKETSQNKDDEELTALLDSALEDFNTNNKPQSQNTEEKHSSQTTKTATQRPNPPVSLWNEEFLQHVSAKFEQNIHALFSPGREGAFSAEELGENIQSLAEAATQTAGIDASPDLEFSNIIAQTLKNMSENVDNLQNQVSDEDLMNLLGTFSNFSDSNTDTTGLLPLMQQIMQSLLSKDILYPALSGIVEKYPDWLEENKSKLSTTDFDRYSEQLKLMKEVCAEFDKEKTEDSQEEKNARFDKILSIMQKIQDSGPPPTDLSGDLGPIMSLDEHGNPQIPPNYLSSQCNLM